MTPAPSTDRGFLNGGGELGARIRELDWTQTPLGPPEQWPIGLKTAVRIMLTSRQPMWVGWGRDLTYLYNDPYKSIIGGKHPEALGQPTAVVWREIWPEISPLLATALGGDQGTYVESQLLIMERNGYPEETYYTFSYSPIPDDGGGAGGILCANTDDTERVIRERQLALLRQLGAAAAESRTLDEACAAAGRALEGNPHDLPFGLLYLLEGDGSSLRLAASAGIASDHPAAPPTLGLTDATPWPVAEALRGGVPLLLDRLPDAAELPRGAWDRPPTRAVLVPLARRGQEEPSGLLICGLNPYRLFDESYRGLVELAASQVAAGIANARAYEEERRRAEALAEIDRAKTVFFSNVSHELRTPLTLILGPLDDLRSNAGDDEVREQAQLIHRNGLRLLRLVNTLLDFSRIEAGRAQAAYTPLDLAQLTRDLAASFRSAIERAGVRLIVDCPPLGEPVWVDAEMWEKVVLNLLSNAFKFTLAGEIEVSLRRVGGEVRLVVRDTGSGIPAEELPRVFDRFHRVEGVRGRTHEGTGIGLALVHELVKLHGGRVGVESEVGRGSAFTVALPLGSAHLPAEGLRSEAQASPGRTRPNAFVEEALRWLPGDGEWSEPPPAPDAPDAAAAPSPLAAPVERILLAEDNADMREYLRRLLAPRWQVEVAADGREALAAARRLRPNLVLTDVMMPGLDGFGLIQALRADPQLRDLPVVVLSARAGEEATLEGLRTGADDYLVKPFSGRELVARIEAQLLRARIRALEEAHGRRIASVFAQVPVAIALLRGRDHVFELANEPYLAVVGGREVIGRPLREALPEVIGQGIVEILDGVFASGQPYVGRSQPIELRQPDGSREEHFFDFVFQPLRDEQGAVEGIAAVGHDVTELVRARRDAEVASRAKDEFLAMLGHELRNPLAPIVTALQLMNLRKLQGGEQERSIIERQVRRLVTLVDDLLDVSRITRGKVPLQRHRVELADALARAIETASPLFEQNRHQLSVDVPRRGLAVDGDVERLAQVISNLLTNAAKYTNPGGRIEVRAAAEGDVAVLTVQDDGIGIAPEVLPGVFELFQQGPQAIDRSLGGLGLGLAIVRSLVELHGGTVEAHSAGLGQGATFVVRLPLATGEPESVAEAPPSPAAAASARRHRVLVVDDNQDAAELLRQVLQAHGYAVRVAHDGPSALALAADFQPELALLDLGLPVMDGFELARQLRADPRLQHTRLVAVTGYGQERDRARSQRSGFAAHLVKPLGVEQLTRVLHDCLADDGGVAAATEGTGVRGSLSDPAAG